LFQGPLGVISREDHHHFFMADHNFDASPFWVCPSSSGMAAVKQLKEYWEKTVKTF
jgi:hypothetical protein